MASATGAEFEDAAIESYRRGYFDDAATYFEEAHQRGGTAGDLFNWAQAERLGGQCQRAIAVYDRYLAASAQTIVDTAEEEARQSRRALATTHRSDCQSTLDAAQPVPAPVPVDPPPVVEPDVEAPTRVVAPAPVSVADDTSDVEPRPAVPRRRDPAGIALLSVGGVITATGIGLLVAAEVEHRRAKSASVHQDYSDTVTRARAEQIAGFVVLPVGVALAVGGAIRLGVVRKRRRRVAFTPGLGHPSLVISGRF